MKFPEPPSAAELATRIPPDVTKIPAGSPLWRVYFRGGKHPTAWNQFRFHGPYAALAGHTCLAEVFQEARVIDRHRKEPWLAGFCTTAALDLLDLTGNWPTRAGGSMAINTGRRQRAQRWARAIHAAYPAIYGILYPSSMDANRPVLALFERAALAMPTHPIFNRALAEPPLLIPISNAAARFGYAVV